MLPTDVDGLQIEIGGQALGEFEPPESELIGIAFAIVVLILAFGSVLAMGLPIGVALFGVGIGAGIITLLSNVMSVPDFAVTLGAMIGLGVGIDYALFIVTRYREGLKTGQTPEEATVTALDTAGRAVVFAGFTVVISLLGMFIMGLAFINGLATGAAVTVLVTMIASVTLLPAFLGFAQHKIEVTRWRGILAAGFVAVALLGVGLGIQPLLVGAPIAVIILIASFAVAPLRKELPPRKEKPLRQTLAYRWSRFVQHRPWSIAILTTIFLLLLSIPVLEPAPRLQRREQLRREQHHPPGVRAHERSVRARRQRSAHPHRRARTAAGSGGHGRARRDARADRGCRRRARSDAEHVR